MMKRRELFSSLASFAKRGQESFVVRPPYFHRDSDFLNNCVDCEGVCADVCNEKIIVIQDDKTPILNFLDSGCTYCDRCAEICEFGVLDIGYRSYIKAKITIDMLECLSWNGTMCFSCKELCQEDAISFLGLFRPEIDVQRCTNCGFCVGVCPTEAVKVEKWQ